MFQPGEHRARAGQAGQLLLGCPGTSTSSSPRIELSRDEALGAIDTELAAGQALVDALDLKVIPFWVQVGYFALRFAEMCA